MPREGPCDRKADYITATNAAWSSPATSPTGAVLPLLYGDFGSYLEGTAANEGFQKQDNTIAFVPAG